jgi:hypothetical protein
MLIWFALAGVKADFDSGGMQDAYGMICTPFVVD